MANNKIIFGNEVLIDLTSDTAIASRVLFGDTFHGKDGVSYTGTCTFNADTSDATALPSQLISGETAYVGGSKITGTLPNLGAISYTISDKNDQITVQAGVHDGSGKVSIDATEKAKIIPGNILNGVEILGVTGTVAPSSDIEAQAKTITPNALWTTAQVVIPDSGYDYLTQVTVEKIPIVYTDNAAGGKTVTIGQVV